MSSTKFKVGDYVRVIGYRNDLQSVLHKTIDQIPTEYTHYFNKIGKVRELLIGRNWQYDLIVNGKTYLVAEDEIELSKIAKTDIFKSLTGDYNNE